MRDAHPQAEEADDGLRERARRWRWRLSGAWQLPTFALCTLAGTVLLHLLPIAGQHTDLAGAFLIAGFANLVVMALAGRPAGWLLRRRRPALPLAIAVDRATTGLMAAMLVLLAVLGGLHHAAVVAADGSDQRQLAAARAYLMTHAPPEYVHNVERASVWKQADFLYRTCFPGTDPAKNLCLIVDLSSSPPRVAPDRDQQPNSVVAGPDNPGRLAR